MMQAPRVVLDLVEAAARLSALQRSSDRLREMGIKYKKDMDSMADGWQGGGGRAFAEAAGKVHASFVINRLALEQLLDDVKASQRALAEKDAQAAKAINADFI